MFYYGHIQNGVVVFDEPVSLPDGTVVEVNAREGEANTPAAVPSLQERLRRLRHAASDCGVSLSNEAVSSEGIYD
jgi:hypothetical protein